MMFHVSRRPCARGRLGGSAILGIVAAPLIVSAAILAVWARTSERSIGAFTTSVSERSPQQLHNIELAASRLDGVRLKPGEIFSFNSTVGQCAPGRGYSRAPAIIGGQLDDAVGGGVCQVSSTLYNTALLAGMKIVERHAHTSPIHSVPPGRDATVSFGDRDLRFRNPLDANVTIVSQLARGRLLIRMTSVARPESTYSVSTAGAAIRHRRHSVEAPVREVLAWREEIRAGRVVGRELLSSDRYAMPE